MQRVIFRLGSFLSAVAAVLLLGAARTPTPPTTQIIALEAQRSLGNGALAAYLASQSEPIAVRAALALGRTNLPAAEALLVPHLHDSRAAVRAMCVYALGLLDTGHEGTALTTALSDPNSAVRVAALDALGRYEAAGKLGAQVKPAVAAIWRALGGDKNPIVRGQAATALAAFAATPLASVTALRLESAVIQRTNLQLRRQAMAALDRGYVKLLSPAFLALVARDPDAVVRLEAARAIGRTGHAYDGALLAPLLRDRSWRVQEQASEALRQLKKEPLTQHWKRIPAFVHLPARAADPFAALPALPRTPTSGKLTAPVAADAITKPLLDPKTAFAMTNPAPGLHPRVRIVTTQGNVYLTLYPEWAPLTVASFLNLVNRGFFDGNLWFRIVPDFVVQTGDKENTGNGDPGFTIGAEENPLGQHSGIIAMGLDYNDKTQTPIRDSAGSQYYITLSPQPHLNRDFSVFGAVTSGFDVLGRLVESDRVIRIDRLADANLPAK